MRGCANLNLRAYVESFGTSVQESSDDLELGIPSLLIVERRMEAKNLILKLLAILSDGSELPRLTLVL
jgi:hypothetical protein